MNQTRLSPFIHLLVRHGVFLFLLLLVPFIITYPLPFHLTDAMFMPGDNFITMWTTAWQVHALASPEDRFWDGNIFHPYPRNHGALRAAGNLCSLRRAGTGGHAQPVLMENLIYYLSLILSAWTFTLLHITTPAAVSALCLQV